MKNANATRSKKETKKVSGSRLSKVAPQKEDLWDLRLYVAGSTAESLADSASLKRICEEHLAGKYHLEVIDLLKSPQLAKGDQIVAVPTLVRRLPAPMRKLIGHLSDTEKVLVGLQLRPREPEDK